MFGLWYCGRGVVHSTQIGMTVWVPYGPGVLASSRKTVSQTKAISAISGIAS